MARYQGGEEWEEEEEDRGHRDEEEEEEDDERRDSQDSELGGVEEGDEELALPTAPVRVACPEDEDFLAALDRMVNENISEAKAMQRDKSSLTQLTAPVSSGKGKKTWEQLQVTFNLRSTVFPQLICFV